VRCGKGVVLSANEMPDRTGDEEQEGNQAERAYN
jgi:hypothetical protein